MLALAGSIAGNLCSLLGLILHGSGLGGNTVPGNCFLPGACPSLPIPSILDFLPKVPAPGCDPGPCPQNIPGINNLQDAGSVALKGGTAICAANAEVCIPALGAGAGVGIVLTLAYIDYLLIKEALNSGRMAACRYPRFDIELDGCHYICDDGTAWFDSSCEAVVYKPYGK